MISLILIIIAAGLNAAMDMNFNQFDNSKFSLPTMNPLFWNPNKSWVNKWKNGDKAQGEKFFLSSTALVFLTDSWHLFKMLFLTCVFLAIILYTPLFNTHILGATIWNTILDVVIKLNMYSIIWGVVFESVSKFLRK